MVARSGLLLAALCATLVLNRVSLLAARQKIDDLSTAGVDLVYVPDQTSTRLLFLGYDQAAADVVWLQSIQYLGTRINDRQQKWLKAFVDRVIELDPRFRTVYMWAGAMMIYSRTFTNPNIRLSNSFYEQAMERYPDDYEPAYRLGLNYYVELHAKNPAEKRRFQELGLSYLERAANAGNAPPQIRRLVAGISSKLGRKDLQCMYLTEAMLSATMPAIRERLKVRLKRADCSILNDSTHGLAAFSDRWKASFPYVDAALYGVMGEPAREPVPDVDWHKLAGGVDLSALTTDGLQEPP